MISTFVNMIFIILGLLSLMCAIITIYILIKMILGKLK